MGVVKLKPFSVDEMTGSRLKVNPLKEWKVEKAELQTSAEQ